ncbi:terminase [Sphingomonas asaccharolytica]|uniref:terminase n=1 Tax=Sphingomonas asaccharolytica TaxID=40681 RepID=UPI00082BD110|nr:terminase [Sphingomonas asaccharolytica]
MDQAEIEAQELLVKRLQGFKYDPRGYAEYIFPWGSPILPAPGLREWQGECLDYIGSRLRNPATRYHPIRLAVASGHGVGKSAEISIIAKWAMDCFADARVVITANTESQLLTKTGPELAKWCGMALTAEMTKCNATSIVSTAPGHEKNWRADLVTWSANNLEAFAGLHNQGRIIVVIYDEASGIDDRVWEVTLGALTDEDTIIIWLAFGNPTKNTGKFRECFGRYRNLWAVMQLDSREVEGTNKAYLDEIIRTYGEDSDIAKVRVRGQFPAASSMQFIASDVATAAQKRAATHLPSDPVIFGVDCARFGDDHSTLAIRCGKDARSRPWKRWQGQDTMLVAGDIATQANLWHPDAIFVDVGAMGAGVVDRLRQLGFTNVIEVNFGGKGREAEWAAGVRIATANKSAEIWSSMRAWLNTGAIPDEQQVFDDLTGREYGYNAEQQIQLERKEHMKARGLPSPDDADALACTFAEPVQPRAVPAYLNPASYVKSKGFDRYEGL